MAYTRGAAATYDAWAKLGNPGWDWDGVFPYFKKVRSNVQKLYISI